MILGKLKHFLNFYEMFDCVIRCFKAWYHILAVRGSCPGATLTTTCSVVGFFTHRCCLCQLNFVSPTLQLLSISAQTSASMARAWFMERLYDEVKTTARFSALYIISSGNWRILRRSQYTLSTFNKLFTIYTKVIMAI